VVLGLVTTKSPRLETPDDLESRVRQAAQILPVERLAISPQCGFATSVLGNKLTVDDEKRKLRTLAETAQRIWG
jgi:5-methyltetrahydropteroyltriglutamate--homocysteine methyltransferase